MTAIVAAFLVGLGSALFCGRVVAHIVAGAIAEERARNGTKVFLVGFGFVFALLWTGTDVTYMGDCAQWTTQQCVHWETTWSGVRAQLLVGPRYALSLLGLVLTAKLIRFLWRPQLIIVAFNVLKRLDAAFGNLFLRAGAAASTPKSSASPAAKSGDWERVQTPPKGF